MLAVRPPRDPLRARLERPGGLFGRFGQSRADGIFWGRLGSLWGPLGRFFGPCRPVSGPSKTFWESRATDPRARAGAPGKSEMAGCRFRRKFYSMECKRSPGDLEETPLRARCRAAETTAAQGRRPRKASSSETPPRIQRSPAMPCAAQLGPTRPSCVHPARPSPALSCAAQPNPKQSRQGLLSTAQPCASQARPSSARPTARTIPAQPVSAHLDQASPDLSQLGLAPPSGAQLGPVQAHLSAAQFPLLQALLPESSPLIEALPLSPDHGPVHSTSAWLVPARAGSAQLRPGRPASAPRGPARPA